MIIEFIGSLRGIKCTKTFGAIESIKGIDIVKLEKEWSPNSGDFNAIDGIHGNPSYVASNFIANPIVNYNVLTITTRTPSERALLPQAGGLETTCMIAVEVDNDQITTVLVEALTQIKLDPTGASWTEVEQSNV